MRNITAEDLRREIDDAWMNARSNEPRELRLLRTGGLPHQPGSYSQYFTAWDIAHGMLRDFSMYTLYPLLCFARKPSCDRLLIGTLLCSFCPQVSRYLGYSGFRSLARYVELILQLANAGASKEELITLLTAALRYSNQLTAWSHHYFPWNLGHRLRYERATRVSSAAPNHLKVEGPLIKLGWYPCGLTVRARLAENLNPRLCSEFTSALPFRVLQGHAVVTGESMYAWLPFVSVAPVKTNEMISRAPAGRLRLSQATGSKLVIQYGRTTENLVSPVLGLVLPRDQKQLSQVGRQVWLSTWETKELVWLDVSLAS